MRNLALFDFETNFLSNISFCESFCCDGQTLYACNNGIIIKQLGANNEVICRYRDSLYSGSSESDQLKVIHITYHFEKELLYLILSNGDIVSVGTNEYGTECILGSVENGIKAAKWSPDQELVALVNGEDNVIVFTNDFDQISEVNLHSSDFGEKEMVAVGWGKEETQFKGSEKKNINNTPVEIIFEKNENINISWRSDAEYFAISSLKPDSKLRYLRIFNKIGTLQYTGVPQNGLECVLDWSDNLLASAQKLPNKYNVCFFEKNGMKHGEFTINSNNVKICELSWSKDSKILALLISKNSGSNNFSNTKYIQLYTVSNYHWYCKFTIEFKESTTPLMLQWDNQKCNILHVMVQKENFVYHYKYTWLFVINKSICCNSKNESFVAVINGNKVHLTAFKRGVIPPPMCTYSIQVESPVNLVQFSSENEKMSPNDMLVQLSDGIIMIYKFFVNNEGKIGHNLTSKLNTFNTDSQIYCNVLWIADKKFLLSTVKINEGKSKPFLNVIDMEEFNSNDIQFKQTIPLEATVAILKGVKAHAVMYKNDGNIYLFDYNKVTLTVVPSKENKTITDLEVIERNGQLFVFCLDANYKFYINSNFVCNGVLSFHIHENFVLLTNTRHELLCLNVEGNLLNLELSNEIFKRKIEIGARLITSVQGDMKVILQMPRGNLECIQPRALSIHTLGNFLNSCNYIESFKLMRKQQINLNLIYDHNPDLFVMNLEQFIEQLQDPDWINLFISGLIEDDVTKTMYVAAYKEKNVKLTKMNTKHSKTKIDTICELMEAALTASKNSEKYLLPILTCYVKRGKVEFLEMALAKLDNLREKESRGIHLTVSFNEAFRYLLYLIDIEELYKIALGMYDLDLALIIANKSQKDPKEYLSFLHTVQKYEPYYQKFVINKHIQRYDKALENLLQCKESNLFNECISFIKVHKLFKKALTIIPQYSERYKEVSVCYGEELLKDGFYEEAGLIFFNSGLYKNAIEAFKKSGNWQEVLICGNELKLTEDELNELFAELALNLSEVKQFENAAIVYLDYLKNVEECISTLAKGKLFGNAYRICYQHQRTDLINQILIPSILEHAEFTINQITEISSTFEHQKNRLLTVRIEKLQQSENKPECDKESDIYSEASTQTTQSSARTRTTNKTYRSAKNRRKQERKLLDLHEGGPYEDLALLISLYNIVNSSVSMKMEIRELLKFLIKINNYELTTRLQNIFDALLKKIEESKSEIWTSDILCSRQKYGPDTISNEVDTVYRISDNAMNMLNPKYTIPPDTQNHFKWKLEILK